MSAFKIISYNVNGLRAATRKGFFDWLKEAKPDVICLQEIKVLESQFEMELFDAAGYHPYFFSAEKKGYSGVAILSKTKPKNIEMGCGNPLYDSEGRIIRADFETCSVMSAYFPSGTTGGIRQDFKMDFLAFMTDYIKEIKNKYPKLILSGDYNIAHHPIDIHNPVSNKNSSGFLPEERQWLSEFLDTGMIDTFRKLNPEKAHAYSWWSYRANARANNKGWRIDYNLITKNLESNLKNAFILPDAQHSDHCPIGVELEF